MLKIAISGKAKSGKSTLANMLLENLGLNNDEGKIAALADPIKKIVELMFPDAKKECLYGASELRSEIIAGGCFDKRGNPLSYRQAIIDFGTLGRSYNDNIWINCLAKDAERSNKKAYIIGDARFINEIKYLRKTGFHMIRLIRDDYTKIDDPSESEQDNIPNSDFDTVLYNNYSLEALNMKAKTLIMELNKIAL